ncbi:MAG: bifunctional hydroxymethylpyrimidine kinase/phosphomethylpyrimidine kinase [Rhodospirillaceae bacterium]|nr:bifunctional hydroxymethylpyrimidine kinase/phosphomethylpyrimidine kinase [Rhodospirillaceae bacterium]
MRGRVLIVAGSDSGGGAGIQADIKAVTCLNGFAATAVTALTAQNTLGVFGVHGVAPAFVQKQIEVVMSDIGADAIKTGMLADAAVIDAVADALARHAPGVPRVVDPVMRAKGGQALLAETATTALIARLVRGATLVTPNLPEAAAMCGRTIATETDMKAAVPALRSLGAGATLLKGGHLDGARVVDLLITADDVIRFEDLRIDTRSTHGTGCTLASAIATGLAQGLDLASAVARARAYVRAALASAPNLGAGHGPLDHAHTVREFPPK